MKANHVHLAPGAAFRGLLVGLSLCVFQVAAHAATAFPKWVQGASASGNQVVLGPGYQPANPVGQAVWNSAVGMKYPASPVTVKPSVIPSAATVGRAVVVSAKVAVPIAGMVAIINTENTVAQAALVGAVTGLVTGGPGNAVFMGSTSALMAWATTGTGVQKNPNFPSGDPDHPFLIARESNLCVLTSAENVRINNMIAAGPNRFVRLEEAGNVCYWHVRQAAADGSSVHVDTVVIKEKTRTAGTPVPATWGDISGDVDLKGNPTPTTLQEALDYGAHPDMTTTVSGPATGEGPSTTTTNNTTGAVTTNTTTNNYNYNNNVVTWNTKDVKTNPDGSKDETVKDPGKDTKPEEPIDLCKEHPEIVACQETDVPEGEIPRSQKTITYAPEDVGFGGGSCPPDRAIGEDHTFSYQATCNTITSYVKPMVLVIAGFMALMIVFGIRSEM